MTGRSCCRPVIGSMEIRDQIIHRGLSLQGELMTVLRPQESIGSKLCLLGASPDTANLGVSALFFSVMHAIATHCPQAAVTVFDYSRGVRAGEIEVNKKPFRFVRCGANLSRRFYRRDSLINMRASAMFGGLGNPGVRALAEADAVLDISGGDSFSDLYGRKRFKSISQPKSLVLSLGTPLILLPQTYGPFQDQAALSVARAIVSKSKMAWARDGRNFDTLKELMASQFDPERHREGVDVAFALPSKRPARLSPTFQRWIRDNRKTPVVGLNVSGLIYNAGAAGSKRFGFRSDYVEIVQRLVRRFVEATDVRIVLVPHVLARPGHKEADTAACIDVAAVVADPDRVHVVEEDYDAMEMKWVISQLDFFCGTRMHSTIAGLSSVVPTSAIAYSKKTIGVFESVGQGAAVADPRHQDAEQCLESVWRAWLQREEMAASLRVNLGPVLDRATAQFSVIFEYVEQLINERRRNRDGLVR